MGAASGANGFSVDIINGTPGNELKCDGRKRWFPIFCASETRPTARGVCSGCAKIFIRRPELQAEDDITASVVVPTGALKNLNPEYFNQSVKFVHNTENRLFQRPDEAVHRGYDKQAEQDLSEPDNFSAVQLPAAVGGGRAWSWSRTPSASPTYTPPMQHLILDAFKNSGPKYFVSSAHPRLVDGKPSKNPRYLQKRPDLAQPRDVHAAEMATRLQRRIAWDAPVHTPVNVVVPGRRNNPPDAAAGIRSLAVFNPVHYMEFAGVVHGIHFEHDWQVALDDRGRLRRRADQGPVQRAAADHRPQRRAGFLRLDGLRRLYFLDFQYTWGQKCAWTMTSAC